MTMTMTLDEYQAAAMRTAANYSKDDVRNVAVLALGIAGEAGEVADYVKKVIGHGHELDRDKLAKEVGDALWYIATISRVVLGMDLSEVAQMNIDKLRKRYPDGFTTEMSMNREDAKP